MKTMNSVRFASLLAGCVLPALLIAAPAAAQESAPKMEAKTGCSCAACPVKAGSDICLETALAVMSAAQQKAQALNTKMDICIVDAGGNLKAFCRMDGAWLGSIDIAIKKAKTARYFDMPTGAIGELSQPGGPLYGIEISNGGLISFPGGLPLKNAEGKVVGAIGVSGSTVENDHAVAAAGANVLLK